MTRTAFSEPPQPPPPETHSPRLERTRRYRGVCDALARTTGTNDSLWHVLFIVLAFFNGIGLILYIAALVLIPERGQARSLGQRLLHGPDRHLGGPDVLILAALGLVIAGNVDGGDGFGFLVFVAFCLLVFNEGSIAIRIGSGSRAATAPDGLSQPLIDPLPAYAVPPDAVTVRRRSGLPALTVGLAMLVVGGCLVLNRSAAAEISPEQVIASALAVLGLGIVVSSWWGRSGLLVPLAVVLGLALAATSVARPAIDAGVGDRNWHPTGAASFRLGVGDATLDLRQVTVREALTTDITARVDVGHLVVIVPPNVRVALHAEARVGNLMIVQRDTNGIEISRDESNGQDVMRDEQLGPEGQPQIRLDASVRLGQVEVRNG